jgi:threonyl-tRNA synthetase
MKKVVKENLILRRFELSREEDCELATESLKTALEVTEKKYVINEGDGAFYNPKIDFHLEDSMGRTWQCGTIQLDFQLPLRFGAEYIGTDGGSHRPIMIHRTVFGSIERFIGILIEHYAGKFPLWLAPVQVKILPISDRFTLFSKDVMMALKKIGIRCEMDSRTEKIGYKILEAQLDKVPYMIVVGQKEMGNGALSVRKRDIGDLGSIEMSEFITILKSEMEG